MAQKSKTQRAKRSAVRAAKKEQATLEAVQAEAEGVADSAQATDSEESKKKLFKKSEQSSDSAAEAQSAKKDKEKAKKNKKPGFLSQVRSELKRVTWPTRSEVLRWSGVVVAALLFFGVFVLILDNLIVTPLLVAISSLSDLI